MIQLRNARVEDATVLAAAEAETARTPGLLSSRPEELKSDAFAEKIAWLGAAGCYLVAEQDGKPVGHALLEPMPRAARAHVFGLTIVVHPGYTGQGIGKTLMRAVLDWSEQDARVGKVTLRVRAGNARAIALYRACGFVEEGRLRDQLRLQDGSVMDDILMAWFPSRTRPAQKGTTLEGREVRLEPLAFNHLDGLCAAGLDETLWEWIPNPVHDRDGMRAFITTALDEQRRGVSMPFATTLKATNQVVGSTRFLNMEMKDRRVEIGWTWIGRQWQRTSVNTEAKYLMLEYAFETLACVRVELKTDALNARSRAAILRLGAREEGTLRRHKMTAMGRIRDTVYYSILDDEWPSVKMRLQSKLTR